jgi:hypothetical protein
MTGKIFFYAYRIQWYSMLPQPYHPLKNFSFFNTLPVSVKRTESLGKISLMQQRKWAKKLFFIHLFSAVGVYSMAFLVVCLMLGTIFLPHTVNAIVETIPFGIKQACWGGMTFCLGMYSFFGVCRGLRQ